MTHEITQTLAGVDVFVYRYFTALVLCTGSVHKRTHPDVSQKAQPTMLIFFDTDSHEKITDPLRELPLSEEVVTVLETVFDNVLTNELAHVWVELIHLRSPLFGRFVVMDDDCALFLVDEDEVLFRFVRLMHSAIFRIDCQFMQIAAVGHISPE